MRKVKEGDRVRCISMPGDPNPVPAGELGTVCYQPHYPELWGDDGKISIPVLWDNGRRLGLLVPPDHFELLMPGDHSYRPEERTEVSLEEESQEFFQRALDKDD